MEPISEQKIEPRCLNLASPHAVNEVISTEDVSLLTHINYLFDNCESMHCIPSLATLLDHRGHGFKAYGWEEDEHTITFMYNLGNDTDASVCHF